MKPTLNGYFRKLSLRCKNAESQLCVGLDPDPDHIPKSIGRGPEGVYKFCCEIIDATVDFAAAFKPNLAFFESIGVEGWHVLAEVLQRVPQEVPVIIDGKRGDIGSTAKHQAKSLFDVLKADAVTVNPLMGSDCALPFIEYGDKGIYFLCLTSNPSAAEFQQWFDLYLQVAKRVVQWNEHFNCGMVVGATQPGYLSNIAMNAPGIPLLIPGVGSQGGDLQALANELGGRPRHEGLINVSRAILYASEKADFGRAARKAAMNYRDKINQAMGRK